MWTAISSKGVTMSFPIDTGIPADSRTKIADGLSRVLADSYTLYLKTHNYHWNVTGPMFQTLHIMFEGQYTELATAVDEVAERIRALGAYAPGSYAAYAKLSAIEESENVPKAEDMIASWSRATRRSPRPPARSFRRPRTAATRSRPTC